MGPRLWRRRDLADTWTPSREGAHCNSASADEWGKVCAAVSAERAGASGYCCFPWKKGEQSHLSVLLVSIQDFPTAEPSRRLAG